MTKPRIFYALIWLVPLLSVALFEIGLLGRGGGLTGNATLCYVIHTLDVLFTMLCVYVGVRWFSFSAVSRLMDNAAPEAFRQSLYRRHCLMRLIWLFSSVVVGLLVYYFTLSERGLYCTLITLLASTVCYPQTLAPKEES